MNRRGFFKFLGALGLTPWAKALPAPTPVEPTFYKIAPFTEELIADSIVSGDLWDGVEYSHKLWAAITAQVGAATAAKFDDWIINGDGPHPAEAITYEWVDDDPDDWDDDD